jgi:hypothetical protein
MVIRRPAPPHREQYERRHDYRESKVSFEGEDAGHEDLEDDHTPDESDESDWPGLTLRLVRLVED